VLGLTQPLAQVMQNTFEPVVVDSVIFKLALEEDTQAARIVGVRLSKDHFEPGDTLHVDVTVAPLLGVEKTFSVSLKIPHYAKGRAILQVMSEQDSRAQDAKRAPGLYQAKRLDDVLRFIASPGRSDVLVMELLSAEQTVTVAGHEEGMLPESVKMVLSQARESDVVQQARQTVMGRVQQATDYVLVGNQTVLINIGGDNDGMMFTGKGTAGEQKR
jgi:hypothetical protein